LTAVRPGMFGLEPTAAADLVVRLGMAAELLDRVRDELTGRLRYSGWVGGDAERVRAEWIGVHHGTLTATAGGLREAAARLRQEIREQLAASDAAGPVPTGPACPAVTPDPANGDDDGWLPGIPAWVKVPADVLGGGNDLATLWADSAGHRMKLEDMATDLRRGVEAVGKAGRVLGPIGWAFDVYDAGKVVHDVHYGGWTDRNTGNAVLTSLGIGLGIGATAAVAVGAAPIVVGGLAVGGIVAGAVTYSDEATEAVGRGTKWMFDTVGDAFSGPLAPSSVAGAVRTAPIAVLDVAGDLGRSVTNLFDNPFN
jgi:hypothetical protein